MKKVATEHMNNCRRAELNEVSEYLQVKHEGAVFKRNVVTFILSIT